MPLPPEGILLAAGRWLRLLSRSSVAQASAALHADSRYLDLSATQYASALDWLAEIGTVVTIEGRSQLRASLKASTEAELREAVFRDGLEASAPSWLPHADLYLREATDLPSDAALFSEALGLGGDATLAAVLQVHGKLDLASRAATGRAGESGVVEAINAAWPGAAQHVALEHDGLGYDITVSAGEQSWHLEIKSTPRRGRLIIYVSRHEFEISKLDPNWRLIVAGLGHGDQLAALATARPGVLWERSPLDRRGGRWETARYELGATDLEPGLGFLGTASAGTPGATRMLLENGQSGRAGFSWMPEPGIA